MATIQYLSRIEFDFGALAGLGEEIARIGAAAGVPAGIEAGDWLGGLLARIGLPRTLGELGVDPALLPEIAGKAARNHLSATNPRPATAEDYLGLLRAAM